MEIQRIDAFRKALPLLKRLKQAGFEAYFVGGCVRNYLLGVDINDIDITTDATPEQVEKLFHQVIPVGVEHGTVIVRFHDQSYEVTTYRKKDANTNEFHFSDRIDEDLLYRDFTMNALAMDIHGRIIDYVEGKKAIKNRLIEAVNDAESRFREDPLRMLRAIRFVAQFNFSIERRTLQAINNLRHLIEGVAIERIKDETDTLIKGPYFKKALYYLHHTKLIYSLPLFKEHKQFIEILEKETSHFESFSHMVALLYYYDRTITPSRWIKEWNGSNKEKKDAQLLTEALFAYEKDGMTPWIAYRLPEALHKPFVKIIDTMDEGSLSIEQLRYFTKNLTIRSRDELKVNGYLLMKWFPNRKRGKWLKEMLDAIEYAVVMNQLVNEEEKIKEWITCHPLATD